jgi:ferredoxin
LFSVILIPLTYLFKTAAAVSLGYPPAGSGAILPPVSAALGNIFNSTGSGTLEILSAAFFWANWMLVLAVLLLMAYTRYLHIIASILNIFFRSPLPKGEIRSIDLENTETFGAASVNNLSQKQMLDLFSCVSCGKCTEACPAASSGKTLSPKDLIQELKKNLLKNAPGLLKSAGEKSPDILPGNIITLDEIWDCTTSAYVTEVCPVI